MVEDLKEAYFTIDKGHTDVITMEALEQYRQENDLSEAFIKQWKKLFDPENTGVITLERFCEKLGLDYSDVREDRDKFENAAAASQAQPEILQIAEDMEPDRQKAIFEFVQQAEDNNKDSERNVVRWLKAKLDEEYGRLWHVIIVKGQYYAFYSYEAGYSFCFKKGHRIYIIYKTPSC
uniref:EF-hand domain-containing protein n=1 Tax=Mesocestoides corti TaxID=53468 RepID=A0A5K3EV59_MESCO